MEGKENYSKNNVVVIGELNVDFILSGEEIMPEWDQEKIVNDFDMVLGSSSAITACCLAGLGLNVHFVGIVGNDYFGEFCIEKLRKSGVNTTYIKKVDNIKTGITFSISTSKDRALLTYMGAIPKLVPADISDDLFEIADHIHFGSYFLQKGMQEHWGELFQKSRSLGISTSFDTGWDPNEEWRSDEISKLLQYTDIFIPSREEFKHIFGNVDENKIPRKVPAKRGLIAIKCGGDGSVLISGDQITKVPGYNVQVIDTTGAGDSFNAGLIYGHLMGKRGLELLDFSNACGALATTRIGGAEKVPNRKEVEDFINANSLIHSKGE